MENTINIETYDPKLDDFYWLTKAISKDRNKPEAYRSIQVKDGWLACTDGMRIHLLYYGEETPESWQNGLYKIVNRKKTNVLLIRSDENSIYPDWTVVFPDEKPKTELSLDISKGLIDSSYTQLVRNLPDDRTLNYQYVSDLSDCYYDAQIYEEAMVVTFSNTVRLAAIMPKRM